MVLEALLGIPVQRALSGTVGAIPQKEQLGKINGSK